MQLSNNCCLDHEGQGVSPCSMSVMYDEPKKNLSDTKDAVRSLRSSGRLVCFISLTAARASASNVRGSGISCAGFGAVDESFSSFPGAKSEMDESDESDNESFLSVVVASAERTPRG